jgi:DNA modification methylase
MRDYPPADWTGAWVRQGSTQRNGKLRGFNNWEPILFYRIKSLLNDVISTPNYHEDFGHPTTKPDELMIRLVELMSLSECKILDPFMGSGTTGVACIRTGRRFIGIELEPKYCAIAVERMERELAQPCLPTLEPTKATQEVLL